VGEDALGRRDSAEGKVGHWAGARRGTCVADVRRVSAMNPLAVTVVSEDGGRVPRIGGCGPSLAAVVAACHSKTIDVGLVELAVAGLTREALAPILTYCAERRCVADDASCPGCRLRTERQGLASLDDFLAQYAEVGFARSSLRLAGPGAGRLEADSLQALAKSWAGEDYWFWARRLLRSLRHNARRAGRSGAPPAGMGATPTLILVRPQLADNIGMVARAMANFGLEHLRLAAPRDGWPNEKARGAAAGANYIVDAARAYASLEAALEDLQWVCATTARQRDLVKPIMTPVDAVAELRARIAAGQSCGIVFGPERNGLETEEVAYADAVVMVPVNPNFASLNLAQAALLMGYEWMKEGRRGTLGRVTRYEREVAPGLRTRGSPPASKQELFGFFEHIEGELEGAGFFSTPEKRPSMVHNMRTMFMRMGATQQEIRTLRGIVKALVGRRRSRRILP
jgi:tRNA/rRNA methyltransferase